MDTQQKLNAMNTTFTTLFLYSGNGRNTWHCELQYDNYQAKESFKFQTDEYNTIDEAVTWAYERFLSITGGTHFNDAVPKQLASDRNLEDEVPF